MAASLAIRQEQSPWQYSPTITAASFAWFFLLFLGFIRVMPSMSIVEVKETLPSHQAPTADASAA